MDSIIVFMEDGTEEKMEVVTIYEMSNSNYHYIIYRNTGSDYYIAKYLGDNVVDLDMNLTSNEMLYAQGILDGLVGK